MAKKNAGTGTGKKKPGGSGRKPSAQVGPTELTSVSAALLDDPEALMDGDVQESNEEENGVEVAEEKANGHANGNGHTNGNGNGTLGTAADVVLEVDPDLILEDPILRDLRDWKDENSKQQAALTDLARTIYEEGQDKPIGVFETADGFTVYDGHRRKRAVKIIRENWEAEFPLRIIVNPEMTVDKAIRLAMLADSQQEKFTATEQARNVSMLRKRFGWEGEKGTKAVAEFLGTSNTTITQIERLAKYPELMDKVDSGVLTVYTALEGVSMASQLPEEERPEAHRRIVERAEELAAQAGADESGEETDTETETETKSGGDESANEASGSSDNKPKPLTPAQKRAAKNVRDAAKRDREKRAAGEAPRPTVQHVRQAAKEVLGDQAKVKAPKMSEAIALFHAWSGPAYPKVMMKFAEAFEEYAHGKKSEKLLEAAWDDIADELARTDKKPAASTASVPASKPKSKPAPTPKPKTTSKPKIKPKAKSKK